jgi:hypothetical protein
MTVGTRFGPDRLNSSASGLLLLRQLIEGANEKQLEVIITLVDFKKAFDSINRQMMFLCYFYIYLMAINLG